MERTQPPVAERTEAREPLEIRVQQPTVEALRRATSHDFRTLILVSLVAWSAAGWVGLAFRFPTDVFPLALGLALLIATGAGTLLHALVVRPILLLVLAAHAEAARLQAALTCPWCRDALPADQAFACDRTGCGALYHPEPWEPLFVCT